MHDKDHNQIDPSSMAERNMPSMEQSEYSSLKTSFGISLGQRTILMIGSIIVIIALIGVNGGFSRGDKQKYAYENSKKQKITNHLGDAPNMSVLPAKPPLINPQTLSEEIIHTQQISLPKPLYKNDTSQAKSEQTPEERKIKSPLLGYQAQKGSKTPQSTDISPSSEQDRFAKNLQPTYLDGAKATLIPDRNLFITKGTFIDCVLETAMSSDVLGMTSCRISRDVYSTSGKIVLLERGTRIVGQYKGGLQQGQSRLFVLWNRAETPNGVVIDLDSGGTDVLGRAGHEGTIDHHFAERFSSAIMLSLIDDIGGYLVNQTSQSQTGNIQLSGTAGSASDAAGIALENSINIRPTFYKNQGDNIHIFVARDLDFRGVYDLKINH